MEGYLKAMNAWNKLALIAVFAAMAWIIVVSLVPFFCNGYFYSVDQPVRVVSTNGNVVTMEFDRFARFSAVVSCVAEIHGVYDYSLGFPCMVNAGRTVFLWNMEYPEWVDCAQGCEVVGSVEYSPWGTAGPTMIYHWESERFVTDGQ